ncbi:MAG: hypothetical protein ACRD6W_18385, partial [Nitrososphaerales archaeon]
VPRRVAASSLSTSTITQNVVMGIRIKLGFMEFTQDSKSHRICPVCQNPCFEVIAKNGNNRTALAIPLYEVRDLIRGYATDRPEVYFTKVFKCLKCDRLEFYASNTATSIPA